jgi:glutathionylspermidine synthase
MTTLAQTANCVLPFTFGRSLAEPEFLEVQSRLALDCFKWDIQIGDTSTLFRQPLLIHPTIWQQLAKMAEDLAAELMAAEQEIVIRPELYAMLGLSPHLHPILSEASRNSAAAPDARVLRFDFHYTTGGWRISEVNSDVPGGYTEASRFTQLVSGFTPHTRPCGDPARTWTDAIMRHVGKHGRVALLSAPGFLEDQQVTAFLAAELQAHGVETFLVHGPSQLNWQAGQAHAVHKSGFIPLDAIVRFYQGEWLLKLPNASGWKQLFAPGKTLVTNPGYSLLTESKRFPLIWDYLETGMACWRSLLPESCAPQDTRWQSVSEKSWVLKEAFSNTGDSVHMREAVSTRSWNALKRTALKYPERWVVQRKFDVSPVWSELGWVYPCIGVFTINGEAAGAYTRVGLQPVIDYKSMDTALLIAEEDEDNDG